MESEAVAVAEPNRAPETRPAFLGRRVIILSLLSLVAGVTVTWWFEQLRYECFSGFLQARFRTVVSVREAQVAEILVSPGTLVLAGQPVVRLKDTACKQRLEAQQREVESLEIELSQSQARLEVELERSRRDLLDRIFEAKLKATQASRKAGHSPTGFAGPSNGGWSKSPPGGQSNRGKTSGNERNSVAHASATVTAADDSSLSSPLTEAELCAQHVEELERIHRELPDKISRMMGVDLAKAHLEHAKAELAQLESQKRDLTLVAEASGTVGVFHKDVGDHVGPYEPIVQLLDEEQPYLLMQISSSRVSDFPPGTLVDLKFPGGAVGQGRVVEIPPQTSSIPDGGISGSETKIAVHVDPVGKLWPSLPFGSVVDVRRRR